MRWFMAAIAALAIGTALPSHVEAVPAGDHTTLDAATAGSALREDARYVVRCQNVRTWRHGHRVWVRRCHRHYY